MARSSVAARLHAAVRIHEAIASGTYPNATRLGALLGVRPKTARKYLHLLADTFGVHPVYDETRHGYHYPVKERPRVLSHLSQEIAVPLSER